MIPQKKVATLSNIKKPIAARGNPKRNRSRLCQVSMNLHVIISVGFLSFNFYVKHHYRTFGGEFY